jgi:hypothetical protein
VHRVVSAALVASLVAISVPAGASCFGLRSPLHLVLFEADSEEACSLQVDRGEKARIRIAVRCRAPEATSWPLAADATVVVLHEDVDPVDEAGDGAPPRFKYWPGHASHAEDVVLELHARPVDPSHGFTWSEAELVLDTEALAPGTYSVVAALGLPCASCPTLSRDDWNWDRLEVRVREPSRH